MLYCPHCRDMRPVERGLRELNLFGGERTKLLSVIVCHSCGGVAAVPFASVGTLADEALRLGLSLRHSPA